MPSTHRRRSSSVSSDASEISEDDQISRAKIKASRQGVRHEADKLYRQQEKRHGAEHNRCDADAESRSKSREHERQRGESSSREHRRSRSQGDRESDRRLKSLKDAHGGGGGGGGRRSRSGERDAARPWPDVDSRKSAVKHELASDDERNATRAAKRGLSGDNSKGKSRRPREYRDGENFPARVSDGRRKGPVIDDDRFQEGERRCERQQTPAKHRERVDDSDHRQNDITKQSKKSKKSRNKASEEMLEEQPWDAKAAADDDDDWEYVRERREVQRRGARKAGYDEVEDCRPHGWSNRAKDSKQYDAKHVSPRDKRVPIASAETKTSSDTAIPESPEGTSSRDKERCRTRDSCYTSSYQSNGDLQRSSRKGRPTTVAMDASNLHRVSSGSTLRQRTDTMLGLTESLRADQYVMHDPRLLRGATNVVAFICTLDALLGITCGALLLTFQAQLQMFRLYQYYMLWAYLACYGCAFLLSGLLFVANKSGQVDLMVAWITMEVLFAILIVCGTTTYITKEVFIRSVEPLSLLEQPQLFLLLYFSSLFFGLLFTKIIGVIIVSLRYKKLIWKPYVRSRDIPMNTLDSSAPGRDWRGDTATQRLASFRENNSGAQHRTDSTQQRCPSQDVSRDDSESTSDFDYVADVDTHEPQDGTRTASTDGEQPRREQRAREPISDDNRVDDRVLCSAPPAPLVVTADLHANSDRDRGTPQGQMLTDSRKHVTDESTETEPRLSNDYDTVDRPLRIARPRTVAAKPSGQIEDAASKQYYDNAAYRDDEELPRNACDRVEKHDLARRGGGGDNNNNNNGYEGDPQPNRRQPTSDDNRSYDCQYPRLDAAESTHDRADGERYYQGGSRLRNYDRPISQPAMLRDDFRDERPPPRAPPARGRYQFDARSEQCSESMQPEQSSRDASVYRRRDEPRHTSAYRHSADGSYHDQEKGLSQGHTEGKRPQHVEGEGFRLATLYRERRPGDLQVRQQKVDAPEHASNKSRRQLPAGAVPAVGSPEEWARRTGRYAPAHGQLVASVMTRYEQVEPKPDY